MVKQIFINYNSFPALKKWGHVLSYVSLFFLNKMGTCTALRVPKKWGHVLRYVSLFFYCRKFLRIFELFCSFLRKENIDIELLV